MYSLVLTEDLARVRYNLTACYQGFSSVVQEPLQARAPVHAELELHPALASPLVLLRPGAVSSL